MLQVQGLMILTPMDAEFLSLRVTNIKSLSNAVLADRASSAGRDCPILGAGAQFSPVQTDVEVGSKEPILESRDAVSLKPGSDRFLTRAFPASAEVPLAVTLFFALPEAPLP